MAKAKTQYSCTACGAVSAKWLGQCSACEAWNTLVEQAVSASPEPIHPRFQGYAGEAPAVPKRLAEIELTQSARISTLFAELDRVLGGGLVPGSVVLMGGDPGIGKSTVLLQCLCGLAEAHSALYVTGEESPQQVTERAQRMGLAQADLLVLSDTQIERILETVQRLKPMVLVIDSIQTMSTAYVSSAPGGVAQVREVAAQCVRFAKQTGTVVLLVGHVTKDGSIAGPRILEHMVDTVLYFEGDRAQRYRLLRAVKNRFGAVGELGVFAMTDKGLSEISNPSALFLSGQRHNVAGSVVLPIWEGTRPMLVEVQALVDPSHLEQPRRVTVGLEGNRLAMLLAVLHRHGRVPTYNKDVFVNVVGGLKVQETAADLALLLALVSSLQDQPLPAGLLVFGEVGLSGEIRPVQRGVERLKEAAKQGFKTALIPKANCPKAPLSPLTFVPIDTLAEALAWLAQGAK